MVRFTFLLLVCLFVAFSPAPATEAGKVLLPGRYNGLIVMTANDPTYKVKINYTMRFTAKLLNTGEFDGFYVTSSTGGSWFYTSAEGDDKSISDNFGMFGLLNYIERTDSTLFVDATFALANPAYDTGIASPYRNNFNARRAKCKLTSKAISWEDSVSFTTSDPALPGTFSTSVKLTWAGS